MSRRETAVRFNTEKSQSWIIGIESLLVGVVIGFLCWRPDVHGAVAIGAGFAAFIIMYVLLLCVPLVFWLWTFMLSALAGGIAGVVVYNSMGQDMGWSIAAGIVAALMVIGLHLTSRRHARAEATPNQVTRIT